MFIIVDNASGLLVKYTQPNEPGCRSNGSPFYIIVIRYMETIKRRSIWENL